MNTAIHTHIPTLKALFLTTAIFAVLPLGGRAASIEERLAELEKKTAALAAENAVLKKELGYSKEGKAPVLVAPGGKETKLVLGGFVQANAEIGDAPDARWAGIADRVILRRARINLTGTFAGDFQAKIESDFGANTLSSATGIRAQLTDGYVQWNKYPEAVVRAGQFKTPFGYEQLASDTKLLLIERALPSDRLTASRQVGASLSGDLADKRLSYSVGAFNGTGVNTSVNDNEKFMWAGRLSGLAYEGDLSGQKAKWTLGANAFTTRDTGTFTGKRDGLGFDTQLVAGPVDLWAEWLSNQTKTLTGVSTKSEGYSLLAALKFTPEWQGIVRYESYDSNKATAATTTTVWTLGVNYLIKGDDIKVSFNYLIGNQPAPAVDGGKFIGRLQLVF